MSFSHFRFGALFATFFFGLAISTFSQTSEDTLANPDAHETIEPAHGHLFGSWGGVRTRLKERGVKLDLHYIGDSLWNANSAQKERFASFDRIRGTVDIDLGTLVNLPDLYFHATAVWQNGGNLGTYLGLVTHAGAERDEREHVQVTAYNGFPAPNEEWPPSPNNHRRREKELEPRNLVRPDEFPQWLARKKIRDH